MASTYRSNLDLPAAAALLGQPKQRVLITTHAKPDGDALGSVVALAAGLRSMSITVQAVLMPPVPQNFRTLRGYECVEIFEPGMAITAPDLVVIVDTGAWSQLSPMRSILEPLLGRTLIIDHHLNGDVDAAHRYIDGKAAACCEVVAELLDELKCPFDATVSEALFVGIASDTGWFRFSNTRPQTHEWAARLKRAGVDHAALYQQLEQTERPEKLALLTRALNSMKLVGDGKVALMTLRACDFADTGALSEETERFIDIPQAIESVQMVVLITEGPANCNGEAQPAIRMSFRSKPGSEAINVAHVAQQFGGGGHARAAGAKVHDTFENVLQRVQDVAERVADGEMTR
jgi:phosphoesterase RecJ-like protein